MEENNLELLVDDSSIEATRLLGHYSYRLNCSVCLSFRNCFLIIWFTFLSHITIQGGKLWKTMKQTASSLYVCIIKKPNAYIIPFDMKVLMITHWGTVLYFSHGLFSASRTSMGTTYIGG